MSMSPLSNVVYEFPFTFPVVSCLSQCVRLEITWDTVAFWWGCCVQELMKTACIILVLFPSRFFSMRFVRINPYGSIDPATVGASKKPGFILSERFDFLHIYNLSKVIHAFTRCMMRYSTDLKWRWLLLIYVKARTFCCLLQAMQQGFGLGIVFKVCYRFCRVSLTSCLF